jgi:hypothetical protein
VHTKFLLENLNGGDHLGNWVTDHGEIIHSAEICETAK